MRNFVTTIATLTLWTVAVTAIHADDESIAHKIHTGLRAQQDAGLLQDFDLNVRVEEGVVWMKGVVSEKEQRFLILEMARRVDDVQKVVNEIAVSETVAPIAATDTVSAETTLPVQPNLDDNTPNPLVTTTQYESAPLQPVPVARANAAAFQQQPAARAPQQTPVAFARANTRLAQTSAGAASYNGLGTPLPANVPGADGAVVPARFDHANMPGYAWPSYAPHPNYAALAYPKQYSAAAWPYIGPFYPYPQVPLGWRKVTLEWDDGWWFLDFQSK